MSKTNKDDQLLAAIIPSLDAMNAMIEASKAHTSYDVELRNGLIIKTPQRRTRK